MRQRQAMTTRMTGINVSDDRFISVNGPPLHRLPDWGLVRRTQGCEVHLHPPVDYEIHYQVDQYVLIHAFTGGEARRATGDGPLRLRSIRAGSTRLMTPGTRVRTVQAKPVEFLAIGVDQARFRDAADRAAGSKGWHASAVSNVVDPGLSAMFREIRRATISDPPGLEGYIAGLVDAVLARLVLRHLTLDTVASGAETLPPALARRLAQTIEDRLDGPIRVADLSDEAGLSRAHFSRAFARNFGTPPRDYILSRRIARARTMLTDTDLSASQIAMRCGFSNPSHLTTAFKQQLGLTPTAYRRALAQSGVQS